MSGAIDSEGVAVAFRLSVRGLVFGAASMAVIAVPVGFGSAAQSASQQLAQCGGINMPLYTDGMPVDSCQAPVAAPPVNGPGAPSQQTLTACSGIPGCLSNALYGPGNVVVPVPNTTVHQSQ
jgi:hypothetical protein